MKPLKLILCLLFLADATQAQKIKGTVTDTLGKPLSNSSVYIKGSNKGVNANSEGNYSLKLDPGKYVLVCQHVGYGKQESNITVSDADQVINFSLKIQEMTLGEVI